MANALGVGLIGAGMIGQGHAYALRLLAEDGEVRPVAVTDLSPDAVDAARAICPFERARHDAQPDSGHCENDSIRFERFPQWS